MSFGLNQYGKINCIKFEDRQKDQLPEIRAPNSIDSETWKEVRLQDSEHIVGCAVEWIDELPISVQFLVFRN